MTGQDRSEELLDAVARLAQALPLQTTPDDGVRSDLLDRARDVLAGEDTDRAAELLDVVALLEPLGQGVEPAPPTTVASVLDLIDTYGATDDRADTDPVTLPVPDSAADRAWQIEVADLHRSRDGATTPEATDLARRALTRPDLARDTVEGLEVPWVDSGMQALFDAARRSHADPPPVSEVDVSGLVAQHVPNAAELREQLGAALDELPTVRGRDGVVTRLADAVLGGARHTRVIAGRAGLGKSTVALAVAARVRTGGVTALRVPAENRARLAEGLYLAAIALRFAWEDLDSLRGAATDAEQIARLWTILDRAREPWLLVLDGAGPAAVGDPSWTPSPRAGTVLVTCRHGGASDWGPDVEMVGLDPLGPEVGGLVVLDRITDPDDVSLLAPARELSRRLDGVPLALSSLGRVAATRRGDDGLHDLLARVGPDRVADPVGTAYAIGVRPDPTVDRRALIRLLACFAPDTPLPVSVLHRFSEVPGMPRPVLDDLVRTGLVDERPGRAGRPTVVSLHPAVAEESRRDRDNGVADAVVDGWAIELLLQSLAGLDAGAPATWPTLRMLEPHVLELLTSPAIGGRGSDTALRARAVLLGERAADALLRSGSRESALRVIDVASALTRGLPADEHARLALRHTRARAEALDGGDHAVAAAELEDVWRLRVADLGAEHPDTLAVRDSLAWVTAERGRAKEARKDVVEVLDRREAILGAGHRDTLETRHRLAWIDAVLGDLDHARAELQEVLRARVARFGREHLDVFGSRYRLAWTLTRLSRLDEAEREYRDLLADLESAVGRLHPMALMVRARVGYVLICARRYDDAERTLRKAWADQQQVLGDTHRRTLRTRQWMACLMLDRGDLEDAAANLAEMLAVRERRFGPDHADTLDSRSYLAWARYEAGRFDAADRIFTGVVADRERVLGPGHEVTLRTRYMQLRARMRRGRLGEARLVCDRLLKDVLAALPADSRVVFDVRHTGAVIDGLLGHDDEAEERLRALDADRTRVLGADHPETLAGRDYLAWSLGRQDRPEALDLTRAVLAARERVLGRDHPHTFRSRYSEAWVLARSGDVPAARTAYETLLADLVARFGPDRPDVTRARHGLVRLGLRDGDAAGVLDEARRLVADQTRLLGPDSVDTLRAREEHADVLLALPDTVEQGWAEHQRVAHRRLLLFGPDHPDTRRSWERLDRRDNP